MRTRVEKEVLGLNEKAAMRWMKRDGFDDIIVSAEPDEGRKVWCVREEMVLFPVTRRWCVTLLVGDAGSITSVNVTSGLIGP